MRAKFIAQPGHTAQAFGTDFPHGEWVKVDHLPAEHQHRLSANPTFEVSGAPDPLPEPVVVDVSVKPGDEAEPAPKVTVKPKG